MGADLLEGLSPFPLSVPSTDQASSIKSYPLEKWMVLNKPTDSSHKLALAQTFFKISVLMIIWLCWVFLALCGLSLVAASGGTLPCCAWASRCGAFFHCGAQVLGTQA